MKRYYCKDCRWTAKGSKADQHAESHMQKNTWEVDGPIVQGQKTLLVVHHTEQKQ